MLSTVLYCLINARYSWLMSLVLITVYEIFLSSFGLRDYVLNNSTGRSGFIAANREGIFSSIGYLALYLSGVQLGCFIFRPRYSKIIHIILNYLCVMLVIFEWYATWMFPCSLFYQLNGGCICDKTKKRNWKLF